LLIVLKSCNDELFLKLSKLLNTLVTKKYTNLILAKYLVSHTILYRKFLALFPVQFIISFFDYKHFICCGWIFPEYDSIFYQGMTMSEIYNLCFCSDKLQVLCIFLSEVFCMKWLCLLYFLHAKKVFKSFQHLLLPVCWTDLQISMAKCYPSH